MDSRQAPTEMTTPLKSAGDQNTSRIVPQTPQALSSLHSVPFVFEVFQVQLDLGNPLRQDLTNGLLQTLQLVRELLHQQRRDSWIGRHLTSDSPQGTQGRQRT